MNALVMISFTLDLSTVVPYACLARSFSRSVYCGIASLSLRDGPQFLFSHVSVM